MLIEIGKRIKIKVEKETVMIKEDKIIEIDMKIRNMIKVADIKIKEEVNNMKRKIMVIHEEMTTLNSSTKPVQEMIR